MLDNRKVHLMTELARYEQKHQKDISLSKYYKSDYIRLEMIKTVVSVTIGYILLMVLFVAYESEYFIANAVTIDYAVFGKMVFSIYILLLAIYLGCTWVTARREYVKMKKRLTNYRKKLNYLRKEYQ